MKNNFIHSWRAYLIYFFLITSLLILIFRIVSLQFIEGDFLASKGKSMLEATRPIPSIRGSILDRNDFPKKDRSILAGKAGASFCIVFL